MESQVLSVLVRNSSGVLARVSGLFSRRGFNIDSLAVGRTVNKEISKMTITLTGNDDVLEQFIKQLNKLEDVLKVQKLENKNSIYRELALIKVEATQEKRGEINDLAKIFRSKIIEVAHNTVIIELTGEASKVSALVELF